MRIVTAAVFFALSLGVGLYASDIVGSISAYLFGDL